MKDRIKETIFPLLALVLIAIGVLSKWIPDKVVEAVTGDAWSAFRFALFVLGMVMAQMFIIFVLRILFVEPVSVYRESMQLIEKYKESERSAKADLISFEARKGIDKNGNAWAGVSVYNGPKNTILNSPIFTLEEIEGFEDFTNSIILHKRGKYSRPLQLSPGGTPCIFDIAFVSNQKVIINSFDRSEVYQIPIGTYRIKTRLVGSFYSTPLQHINPKDEYWLLTIETNNVIDIRKA